MLTNSDYNAFATTLGVNFVNRCTGLDESSGRIIDRRPTDHVLAGFLTPVDTTEQPPGGESPDAPEGTFADSAYEQTSIGMEWLAPIEILNSAADITVRIAIDFTTYVRRLPAYQEQKDRSLWIQRGKDLPRTARAIKAWTRHPFETLTTEINLSTLYSSRQIGFSCTPLFDGEVEKIVASSRAFPGLQHIDFTEGDLATLDSFDEASSRLPGRAALPGWDPFLDVRFVNIPTLPHLGRIALRLINRTPPAKDTQLDFIDPNLYAVRVSATLPSSCHVMSDFHELPASFRYDRKMWAVGINCQIDGKADAGAVNLTTNATPIMRANRLEPREIEEAAPTFSKLTQDPVAPLLVIAKAMADYLEDEWRAKIDTLDLALEREEAQSAADDFSKEMQRFNSGVELLRDPRYPHVLTAFKLMNEAMGDMTGGKYDRWRLFQIVFVVSQLSGLAGRQYPELNQPEDDWVDILWFAAGGGKTEAFLGVILWQAFFDRLRGKKVGTSAFVRFPLRLLAFQQLQRIAKALASAEKIRVREGLGGARFSIGDFAGGTVTPNDITDIDHQRFQRDGVDERYQRIFSCPFCGERVKVRYVAANRLIEHFCADTSCASGERLPAYIVDSDIYRYLPTVIVSTVDKIALLGFNQRFSNLFGRIDLVCPTHGAAFRGTNSKLCAASQAFAKSERLEMCGSQKVLYGPFLDTGPALMVQDELHLLSSALGAFDAHYETAVAALSKALGQKPWKVIAATATIKAYETHAAQLYLKKARQFPGPGPSAFDSFYYREVEDRIGRLFIGVLGVGRKHTPSLTRALSLLYLELQRAREMSANDLAQANAEYGTSVSSRDDFNQLVFTYELPLTYVLTRKGSDQVAEAIESRVKGELREVSPTHGDLKVDTFNSGIDIAEMTATIDQISSETSVGDPAERLRGLITTNIIGHGVDVDRFNVIFFAGFPRMVAEYIQASARVGRTFPGLSILVITPQNERDRSIFDRFGKFHEYLDRLVDPSAITRWTEPTILKTLPGLLSGYLMAVASSRLNASIATVESFQREVARPGADALNESQVLDWIEEAFGTRLAPSQERYTRKVRSVLNNRYRLVLNEQTFAGGKPKQLGLFLGAMRSLRDIDEPGEVRVSIPNQIEIIKNLIHG